MSNIVAPNTASKVKAALLYYFVLTGVLTVSTGIILYELGKLPAIVTAIATGISGLVTFIAGSWVLIERFFLPKAQVAISHPRLSSRLKFLVVVGSIVSTFLLDFGVVWVPTIFTPSSPPPLSMTQVVGAFCNAIKSKNYPSAYGYLSKSAKDNTSEQVFSSDFQGYSDCTVKSIQQNGDTAEENVIFGISIGIDV